MEQAPREVCRLTRRDKLAIAASTLALIAVELVALLVLAWALTW